MSDIRAGQRRQRRIVSGHARRHEQFRQHDIRQSEHASCQRQVKAQPVVHRSGTDLIEQTHGMNAPLNTDLLLSSGSVEGPYRRKRSALCWWAQLIRALRCWQISRLRP